MFTIKISPVEWICLNGLQALDMRRKLGLPDGSSLQIAPYGEPTLTVSEEFARQHCSGFDSSSEYIRCLRRKHAPLLAKGDIVWNEKEERYQFNPDMTADRKLAIWEALQ